MSYVTTPGQQQFSIDTESGDWLTANRTPDGVFFDRSGLVYLRQADREALICWLAETPADPPAPKRSCTALRESQQSRDGEKSKGGEA